MGEAADDAIDRGIEEWLSGEYDDDGSRFNYGLNYGLSLRSCRYCKASNLHWELSHGQWRLFTAQREMHSCVPKVLFK